MDDRLFTSLKGGVRWKTAFHTFGGNHCSLIGLLVDWWVSGGPHREVLEAPPWHGSMGSGRPSDAVLMENGICTGIVEVEGTDYPTAINRMVEYIVPDNPYGRLDFGIFLAYPTKRVYIPTHDLGYVFRHFLIAEK